MLEIKVVSEASHNDHSGEPGGACGYVLKVKRDGKEVGTLGFTGDSQWHPDFAGEFKECQLVCSHMGSALGDKEKGYKEKPSPGAWEALLRKKNHPYLPGEVLFLEQLRKLGSAPGERIVVLSEFGEEMKGGMREDVCERINRCLQDPDNPCWRRFGDNSAFEQPPDPPTFGDNSAVKQPSKPPTRCSDCTKKLKKSIRVIPADIGLRVSIRANEKPQVHCALCERFHDPDDMHWVAHGHEEALFFVCGPCHRGKANDVKTAKYDAILASGRPLRRVPGA